MSRNRALAAYFECGRDVHAATAARVFGIAPEDVTRAQRRNAKEVNYGIPHGVSAWGLACRLRIPEDGARRLIADYLRAYPGVAARLSKTIEEARRRGFVETLLGRTSYVPFLL